MLVDRYEEDKHEKILYEINGIVIFFLQVHTCICRIVRKNQCEMSFVSLMKNQHSNLVIGWASGFIVQNFIGENFVLTMTSSVLQCGYCSPALTRRSADTDKLIGLRMGTNGHGNLGPFYFGMVAFFSFAQLFFMSTDTTKILDLLMDTDGHEQLNLVRAVWWPCYIQN